MTKKRIKVMITAFRDGFQSVYGARVFTQDFIPAVEAARHAGVEHFEAGGGARFQALYFYSNEDAFDMMDQFRAAAGPSADLQTLARGVNVVGLESQPSDIVKLHAVLFKKHGITTIRNFDALNDVNNLIYSGKCIADAGLNHEVVVTMMSLPPGIRENAGVHTPEYYVQVLREILTANIPYTSVCFKDASGTSTPRVVHETIKGARKLLPQGTKLVFHTHDTAGTGTLCYQAALDAGVDAIDLSMAPVSGGTCQPDVLSMWHALRGTDYDLGIDFQKMCEAEEVFKECMKDYFLPPESKAVEPLTPLSPMPGGALTANTQMMRDNNLMDRYQEVLTAMREVVELGGFGTSVTPVSQFYFQQAFNNVMFGPWKKFADGYGKMVLGYFGKTPVTPDSQVVKAASEQMKLEPTTKSPLEINDADPNKGIAAARKMLQENDLPVTDENIFIAATCREKGINYLKGLGVIGVRKKSSALADGKEKYTVKLEGTTYEVVLDDKTASVDGRTYAIEVEASGKPEPNASSPDISRPAAVTAASQASGALAPPQPVTVPKPTSVKRAAPSSIPPAPPKPAAVPAAEKGPAKPAPSNGGKQVEICAELPGLVIKVFPDEGDSVSKGDPIFLLESMKMEISLNAPASGTITSIEVSPNQQINAGQRLACIVS